MKTKSTLHKQLMTAVALVVVSGLQSGSTALAQLNKYSNHSSGSVSSSSSPPVRSSSYSSSSPSSSSYSGSSSRSSSSYSPSSGSMSSHSSTGNGSSSSSGSSYRSSAGSSGSSSSYTPSSGGSSSSRTPSSSSGYAGSSGRASSSSSTPSVSSSGGYRSNSGSSSSFSFSDHSSDTKSSSNRNASSASNSSSSKSGASSSSAAKAPSTAHNSVSSSSSSIPSRTENSRTSKSAVADVSGHSTKPGSTMSALNDKAGNVAKAASSTSGYTPSPNQPNMSAGKSKSEAKTPSNGTVGKENSPSLRIKEPALKTSESSKTKNLSPAGQMKTETFKKADGSKQVIQYAANGKPQHSVISKADGTKESTSVRYGKNGNERATETVKMDSRGRQVSKTVVVKQTTVIARNTTILSRPVIVKNYDRGHFGFVYHPVYAVHSPVFVSWFDPYWYTPLGVVVPHPFHYAWGWSEAPWYQLHHHYWACYDVYPTPSHWVTDWMIANYIADRVASSGSAEQAREEARQAREEAEKARAAAERATEEAEIAEAKAAQEKAEAAAAMAENRAAKAEASLAQARKENVNATPMDAETKELLRDQIEQAVFEKKHFAEEVAKGGNPVPADLSRALADPKHVYPVSSSLNVMSATDQTPAGMLSEGDLLRIEPGQGEIVKNANENTFVTMRVLSSKGEDGEVKAGALVSLPLKALQDFDSEFRAKLDLGLAEADQNKELFKTGAL